MKRGIWHKLLAAVLLAVLVCALLPLAAAAEAPKMGNDQGNLQRQGWIVLHSKKLYYSGQRLWVANEKGENARTLFDGTARCLNVMGDTLYFIGWAANEEEQIKARGIYAMKLADESIEKLADGEYTYLGATKSTLYYNRVLSEDATELVARSIKTGEETLLTPPDPDRKYSRIFVEEKLIYALATVKGQGDVQLVSVRLDGGGVTEVTSGQIGFLSMYKGNMYYLRYMSNGGPIYRMTPKGKETLVFNGLFADLLLVGDYMYATDAIFRDISRIKVGSDIYYTIFDRPLVNMNVIGTNAYFTEYTAKDNRSHPFRFKIDTKNDDPPVEELDADLPPLATPAPTPTPPPPVEQSEHTAAIPYAAEAFLASFTTFLATDLGMPLALEEPVAEGNLLRYTLSPTTELRLFVDAQGCLHRASLHFDQHEDYDKAFFPMAFLYASAPEGMGPEAMAELMIESQIATLGIAATQHPVLRTECERNGCLYVLTVAPEGEGVLDFAIYLP